MERCQFRAFNELRIRARCGESSTEPRSGDGAGWCSIAGVSRSCRIGVPTTRCCIGSKPNSLSGALRCKYCSLPRGCPVERSRTRRRYAAGCGAVRNRETVGPHVRVARNSQGSGSRWGTTVLAGTTSGGGTMRPGRCRGHVALAAIRAGGKVADAGCGERSGIGPVEDNGPQCDGKSEDYGQGRSRRDSVHGAR